MIELQPFSRADYARLISWVPDARFLLQWSGPAYVFPLDTTQLVDNQREAETDPPRKFLFKAALLPGGDVVGHIELFRHKDDASRGRLARVLIGPWEARGRGYGLEMVRQAVRFGFETAGLAEIDLAAFAFNESAIRCYEQAGFEKVEFVANARRFEDEVWSMYRMALSRERWRELQEAGRG